MTNVQQITQYVLHSLCKTLKKDDLIRAPGRAGDVLCCENKCVCVCKNKTKQNKDSMWHVLYRICFLTRHMAAPAGVLILLL